MAKKTIRDYFRRFKSGFKPVAVKYKVNSKQDVEDVWFQYEYTVTRNGKKYTDQQEWWYLTPEEALQGLKQDIVKGELGPIFGSERLVTNIEFRLMKEYQPGGWKNE